MRILYVATKYDYGIPSQGLSFEHCNFFDSIYRMGHDILYFDFATLTDRLGRSGMNRRLSEVANGSRPDLIFTFLAADEFDRATIQRISESGI